MRILKEKTTLENSFLLLVLLGALAGLNFVNFLLFHTLIELFSIIVAYLMFVIALYSQEKSESNFLIFLGCAYGFVGSLDLIHTLAYEGMGVFPWAGTDLPTQLWIMARYMESISLLIALVIAGMEYEINFKKTIGLFTLASIILLSLLYLDLFPTAHIQGEGLTDFKIISEYIISFILLIGLFVLKLNKDHFTGYIYKLTGLALITTIIAEIFFTFYIDVYGISNIFGHLFKLISFYLIYKAIVETGLKRPYDLLYRNLNQQKNITQSSLDSLSANIAVLDGEGIIKYTNKAWDDFARDKGKFPAGYEEGVNYLEVFKNSRSELDESAAKVAEAYSGIKNVIAGEKELFTLEYPFHSPEESRWFEMRVTPFRGEGDYDAVVAHEDITRRKLKSIELEKAKEKLEVQFEQGRKLHEQFLPPKTPEFEDLTIATHYSPAEKLGGDFYNHFKLRNHLIFYISDVSGHDLSSSMLNIFLKETINSYFVQQDLPVINDKTDLLNPAKIMRYIHRRYNKETFPGDYFISLIIGTINLNSKIVSFSNAGIHYLPLLLKKGGGISSFSIRGLPICNLDYRDYSVCEFTLERGDSLFLNTDGLIEQENKEKQIYGERRLIRLLYENKNARPSRIMEEVYSDFADFKGEIPVQDDVTCLLLKHEED